MVRSFNPEFFTHLLNEANLSRRYIVKKYKVIQDNLNELRWEIISSEDFKQKDKNYLVNYLEKYLDKG